MGRAAIYQLLIDDFHLNSLSLNNLFGYGLGSADYTAFLYLNFNNTHSDLLKLYIEGGLIFFIFYFYIIYQYYATNKNSFILIIITNIYYLADTTLIYSYYTIIYFLMMYYFHKMDQNEHTDHS